MGFSWRSQVSRVQTQLNLRLHEVISRAATLNSGLSPAGLAPVKQKGVQDIDVGTVLKGHMELQAKMADIIRIVNVDA